MPLGRSLLKRVRLPFRHPSIQSRSVNLPNNLVDSHMSNPSKLNRIIELALQIKNTRESLVNLESELEQLLMKSSPRSEPVKKTARTKPSRNKVKIVRLLRKRTEPVQLQTLIAHLGLSQSGTNALLKELINAGEVMRTGFGLYAIKS
jgi:hypothetical protein